MVGLQLPHQLQAESGHDYEINWMVGKIVLQQTVGSLNSYRVAQQTCQDVKKQKSIGVLVPHTVLQCTVCDTFFKRLVQVC